MQTEKSTLSIEVEELSKVKKKVSVTVPAETVGSEYKAAYQNLKSTAAIAGFRKGAVPLNVLKTKFGPQVEADLKTRLVEISWVHALNEKNIVPVAPPKVEMKTEKVAEKAPFSYTLTLEVAPVVDVNGYIGMSIKKTPVEIKPEEIEKSLTTLRESKAVFKEVDRGAKETDLVECDLEGSLNGVPIKNSKTENYPIVLGVKSLLPGFDEAIMGAKKGEVKQAKITFPANYSEGGLGGKVADYKITIKTVKEKIVPELDDEFAKDIEFENLAALRVKVEEEIKRIKEKEDKEKLKTVVLDTLIEQHSFEVPGGMADKYYGVLMNKVATDMQSGILDPADRGLTKEQFEARYRNLALRQAKEDIILDTIANKEKIEIPKEDVEKAMRALAASRNVPYEDLMKRVEQEGALDIIIDGLKHEKVFEKIFAEANYI